ncbi:MAG TPA: tetratricopeptide repeat protein [Spirochaetia bacterium]|nr:tetratricopeptide repeat protein [Spirochaetia bacterium]
MPGIVTIVAVLIFLIILLVSFTVYLLVFRRSDRDRRAGSLGTRDREAVVREANRRLSQNPKDSDALSILADLYYNEEAWDKSLKTYALLMNLCATNPELDEFLITLRYGLSAIKLDNLEEAYKGLVLARTRRSDVFELNYNLGYLEYRRRAYEKAVPLLTAARELQPDHLDTLKYLGHALYRTRKYKEAIAAVRKVIDQRPDDKETLFIMGQCFYELGQTEQSVRLFSHLRPDPVFGPQACLHAGTLRMNARQYEQAQMDFEIGLRHKEINPEVSLELRYRLAVAYERTQNMNRALPLLVAIHEVNPDYKDVATQIRRVRELVGNQNLQTYLISPISDFVALCRKVVSSYFPQSKVKISDILVTKNDYADILTDVETVQWQDIILFRFFRTTGAVGELLLRDFHLRLKDVKAGRGLCLSAGTFTEDAKKFVEARLIDLIEKDDLLKVLNRST